MNQKTYYLFVALAIMIVLFNVADSVTTELGLEKGSGTTPRELVGTLSQAQVTKIAQDKMADLNCDSLEAAKKIVAGTARSMGVTIEGEE